MNNQDAGSKSIVAIGKARDYDYPEVYQTVEKCIGLLGDLRDIIKPGNRVFVKINHLPPSSPPEKGIVTHPVFVKAVINILKTTGAYIIVGDDIGKEIEEYTHSGDPEGIDGFRISGIRQVCEETNVELSALRESGFVETKIDGKILDTVHISKVVLESDIVVNLPKLKTHFLTLYSGGIKNIFGTIPKGHRVRYHTRYNDEIQFNQMLVDVYSAVKPTLTIMDGILAMEGPGPANGILRNAGLVLASRDTIALDTVAMNIIGLNSARVPIVKYAHERGLGVADLENITTVGEDIDGLNISKFQIPKSHFSGNRVIRWLPSFLTNFLQSHYTIKPKINHDLCKRCMECKKTCYAQAISVIQDKVIIDKQKCIACYCCHEACRYDAILIKPSLKSRFVIAIVDMLSKILRTMTFRR